MINYEVHIASKQAGKVAGAEEAARAHHQKYYSDKELGEVKLDPRKYPETDPELESQLGISGKRPISPVAVRGLTVIEKAAELRAAQVRKQLQQEGDTQPKEGVQRMTVAQESGMKVNPPTQWRRKGIVNDVTVAVAQDLDHPDQPTAMAVSDGIRVRFRDFASTVIRNAAAKVFKAIEPLTIGQVIQKRLAKKGTNVNHQDWYVQYDFQRPGTPNQPRSHYIAQASKEAAVRLPAPTPRGR